VRSLRALKVANKKPSETAQLRDLLAQLVALTDTVARLRQTQQRAAQAVAARGAAEQLHAVAARYPGRPRHRPVRSAAGKSPPSCRPPSRATRGHFQRKQPAADMPERACEP
jgi:hypothetical protein